MRRAGLLVVLSLLAAPAAAMARPAPTIRQARHVLHKAEADATIKGCTRHKTAVACDAEEVWEACEDGQPCKALVFTMIYRVRWHGDRLIVTEQETSNVEI